jgi:AraC-like DNA-binding protein
VNTEPELHPIAARLHELMAELEHDLPRFSQQLGCSEAHLHQYLSHPTGSNLHFLAILLTKVSTLAPDWLLTGRGEMFRTEPLPPYKEIKLRGNTGNAVGSNHGIVLNITTTECQQQLTLANMLVEQQQQRIADKDRIISLLESSRFNQ